MDDPMTRRGFGALALVGALATTVACHHQPSNAPSPPAGTLVHTLTYVPGPAWKTGEPIAAQGLEPHFAFMGGKFGDGTLLANGPFGDAVEGLYVFAVEDGRELDAIVASDPAVEAGTLVLESSAPWLLIMDAFDAPRRDGESFFVLEYRPGPKWKKGRGLAGQNIDRHMQYVEGLFERGTLIAGGPIPDRDRGRYIVSAVDEAAAAALVSSDPGVVRGVFAVDVRPWMPAQRQSARSAAALAVRPRAAAGG